MKIVYSPMKTIFGLSLLLIFTISCIAQNSNQKAILVTGATSGIGLKITELLSSKGYYVYAGARKQRDMERLNAMDNVMAVKLDVTKWEDINAAVKTIENEGRGLHGLVNNAGVSVIAPLIEVDEEDLDFVFNVNIYGPYRVTKAFAPLIIESKGRITTTGSIAGIVGGAFYGPYSMSKHAVEAFSDVLAAEMEQFGVHVSVIEPGAYNSKISANMKKRAEENEKNTFSNSIYKEQWEANYTQRTADRSIYKDPIVVAEAAEHALFSEKPKRRYMVVPDESQSKMTIQGIMREMVQLNQDQTYSYDRDELVKMLDELLTEQ